MYNNIILVVTLDGAYKELRDLVINKFMYRGAIFWKLFLENNSFRQTDIRPYRILTCMGAEVTLGNRLRTMSTIYTILDYSFISVLSLFRVFYSSYIFVYFWPPRAHHGIVEYVYFPPFFSIRTYKRTSVA
jgi:hypothetical protein